MILYRGIAHLNDPKLSKLGVYWTTDPKMAYPYGCRIKELFYYVYEAEVKDSCIDTIPVTEWPHEKEIILKEGCEVEVLSVKKYRKPCQTFLENMELMYKAKI